MEGLLPAVVIVALLVACGSVRTIVRHRIECQRHGRALSAQATELLQKVAKMAGDLHTKVLLLVEHTDDYFHSLTRAGLPRLQEIDQDLSLLVCDAERYYHQRQYAECLALCSFLLDSQTGAPPPEEYSRLTTANLPNLASWGSRSKGLLIACVQELEDASQLTEEIRVARPTKLRPTSLTLGHLRDQLK